MDEQVKTSFSHLDSVYQRRADLIPNLVATVKGEANFEQNTLTQVIEARASATQIKVDIDNAEDLAKYQQAQWNLSQALGKLLVVSENYPSLQTNQSFRELRVQIEGSENRISVERMNYNTAVQNYNTKIRQFPSNIVAKMFDFEKAALFKANEGSENAPTVSFE